MTASRFPALPMLAHPRFESRFPLDRPRDAPVFEVASTQNPRTLTLEQP
ncbi:MAG: hypothetical protein R3284_06650 [Rubricoccaceae bacterium]|nr:hypothetical protein [Rubricoccaceae bacterium]